MSVWSLVRCSVLVLLSSLGPSVLPAAAGTEDLVVEVVTDRAIYPSGVDVVVTAIQCNPTDEDISYTAPCGGCGRFVTIFDGEGEQIQIVGGGGILVPTTVTFPAGECLEQTFRWGQEVYDPVVQEFVQVPDGEYSAEFVYDEFGPVNPPPVPGPVPFLIGSGPVAIPTLSSVGVWGLVALLSLSAVVWLRRSRASASTNSSGNEVAP